MPLSAGEKLGPYEVLARIGTGGMGDVWKARDSRLDRTVAIKVSKVAFSKRFEREARVIAALNHPHICTLYDVGPDYLVMELVDGKPITGPMSPKQAIEYSCQILDALDCAHRKGVILPRRHFAQMEAERQGTLFHRRRQDNERCNCVTWSRIPFRSSAQAVRVRDGQPRLDV